MVEKRVHHFFSLRPFRSNSTISLFGFSNVFVSQLPHLDQVCHTPCAFLHEKAQQIFQQATPRLLTRRHCFKICALAIFLILTSQLPVSRWHEQIGDPALG
jgi:hypothetical protein